MTKIAVIGAGRTSLEMMKETEKREFPVDNIVRQLYVVQQICGQTYTDLHPFYEHINDAVKYMNDLKAQMNSKFRVIKRLEFLVA